MTAELQENIFLWDRHICCNNWCSKIFETSSEYGLEHCFFSLRWVHCNGSCLCEWLYALEKWCGTIIVFKSKSRTYVNFNRNFKTEDHAFAYILKYQLSLSQFRAGTLPLHIKTGRWINTSLEETLCSRCVHQCIEDKFNFLCVCRLYQNERFFFVWPCYWVASGIW